MSDRWETRGYPEVWLRWVRRQVAAAVAYELRAADPRRGPHLDRLPVVVDPAAGDRVVYLRGVIAGHSDDVAGSMPADRSDRIADLVLADPAVTVAEPQLAVLLAWRLASSGPLLPSRPEAGDMIIDSDHECFDPERLAADLVESGLIAPAWRTNEPVAQQNAPERNTRYRRNRNKRAALCEGQLALLG